MQGVARATAQMNRRMWEREQRKLEREQLQTNQDRREERLEWEETEKWQKEREGKWEDLVDGENGKRQENNATREEIC